MPDFSYTDLLPLGPDTTEYRLLSEAGVACAVRSTANSLRWSRRR